MSAVSGQLFILPSTGAAMGWRAVFRLGAVGSVLLVNGEKEWVELFLFHQHLKLLTSCLLFLLHFYPQYCSLLLSFISSFFLSIFRVYLLTFVDCLTIFIVYLISSSLLVLLPVILNSHNT
ncbi:mCG148277 [Mus musculus]|jgi:hypothetical protein|nr:mCG148277 [Mus musculus]